MKSSGKKVGAANAGKGCQQDTGRSVPGFTKTCAQTAVSCWLPRSSFTGTDLPSRHALLRILLNSTGTIEELTPWYAYFRSALLENRPRTVYETFGHPVACGYQAVTVRIDATSQQADRSPLRPLPFRHHRRQHCQPRAPQRFRRPLRGHIPRHPLQGQAMDGPYSTPLLRSDTRPLYGTSGRVSVDTTWDGNMRESRGSRQD